MDQIVYQDYFNYIIKEHGEKTHNAPIRICVTNIYHRTCKAWSDEITWNNKSKIAIDKKCDKNDNDENVSLLKISEVVFVHSNIVNNYYQHNLRVLYFFLPNKSLGQLLDISKTL